MCLFCFPLGCNTNLLREVDVAITVTVDSQRTVTSSVPAKTKERVFLQGKFKVIFFCSFLVVMIPPLGGCTVAPMFYSPGTCCPLRNLGQFPNGRGKSRPDQAGLYNFQDIF